MANSNKAPHWIPPLEGTQKRNGSPHYRAHRSKLNKYRISLPVTLSGHRATSASWRPCGIGQYTSWAHSDGRERCWEANRRSGCCTFPHNL